MAFLDVIFPPTISYHSTGGPMHGINIVQTNGGQTYRNQYWIDPLRKYDAMVGVQTDAQLDALYAFFLVVGANSFRWKDWKDFNAVSANGLGTVSVLSGTTLQLTKTYTFGAYSYVRKITKPIIGTLAFTRAGSSITPTSIDYTTGIVTVLDSSGVWTWTGQFHIAAYFGTNVFTASYDDVNNNSVQLPVVEER